MLPPPNSWILAASDLAYTYYCPLLIILRLCKSQCDFPTLFIRRGEGEGATKKDGGGKFYPYKIKRDSFSYPEKGDTVDSILLKGGTTYVYLS